MFESYTRSFFNALQAMLNMIIGIGTMLAIVMSWTRNESVLWALLHACLGWLYVIYFVCTRTKKLSMGS